MMMDCSDAWLNHSTGVAPNSRHKCANNPLTGSMNMFFQTSAETVGITKNGAMTRMRTIPCPQIGWLSKIASSTPKTTVMNKTPPTMISVD